MSDLDFIVEILRKASRVVDDAGIPLDLRPAAFSAAIDLLNAESQVMPDLHIATAATQDSQSATMARVLGISASLLDMVYDRMDGDVELVIHRSKLPQRKAPAMKTVAMLVAAGRQAAGLDEWTSVNVIREVCRHFGVLDLGNFATEVASLGDAFLVRGKGQSRAFKVTRHGFEEAGRLITQLVDSA
jgi:hypothetical protein